jgi:hypothetical protein
MQQLLLLLPTAGSAAVTAAIAAASAAATAADAATAVLWAAWMWCTPLERCKQQQKQMKFAAQMQPMCIPACMPAAAAAELQHGIEKASMK